MQGVPPKDPVAMDPLMLYNLADMHYQRGEKHPQEKKKAFFFFFFSCFSVFCGPERVSCLSVLSVHESAQGNHPVSSS